MHKHRYGHLAVMTALSFIAMFILMYAMIDRFADVYPNVNQFYMAGLMAAPMLIIELLVMRGMYPDTRMNPDVRRRGPPRAGAVLPGHPDPDGGRRRAIHQVDDPAPFGSY
ncbi:hypothetical protein [Bradyrhizobium icense]|uniref:hypothetical protein n=1 Tax=Bradyrhizobium icense TaxID=1274631 RepID=UPI0018D304A6|nr:hypothetical protein [Bradyrhizobium icense]